MRIMTPTESAYVAGIIDGEGSIEFKIKPRIRRDRKGSPTYNTFNCPYGSTPGRWQTD